jgi:beta-N-acetylhexosaminidase
MWSFALALAGVRFLSIGHFKRILLLGTLLVWITGQPITGILSAQEADYALQAQALLDSMTPEERVGQLFLVTFEGNNADVDSDIADLIVDYHVGGVMLRAENDNISDPENPARGAALLINELQTIALHGRSLDELTPATDGTGDIDPLQATTVPTPVATRVPVPLIVATIHEGDGPPHSAIWSGLTDLPSPMAVGATWLPEQSRITGEIAGRELAAIGINMILGPSLDVLENPRPFSQSDLGVRTFGGDPYWVGQMGRAYTNGLHSGSDGRVAVIAKHFPGYASSDRPLNEEVGTVRKSLEQLKQIELAPFFAVTGEAEAEDDLSTVDGLLTAHVRYQGFQGNIRATTAPVSFDPQALATLMQLPQFASWRDDGGVIVSDSLGVRAVERFYDVTGQEFPHRLVAKDALLAGNDLLLLSDFGLGDVSYETQLANIKDTVDWFNEKYVSDQNFQQRIDEAALKILQLKLRLYDGQFDSGNVLIDANQLGSRLNQGEADVFDLSQQAITLISPRSDDLLEQLPPGVEDDIVIFTDIRESRQCSTCPLRPWLDEQALEQRLLALYGPQASEQVRPGQISSFSYADLSDFLQSEPEISEPITVTLTPASLGPPSAAATPGAPLPTPTLSPGVFVQGALTEAEWVIFATLDPAPQSEDSDALHQFLAQRPDIVRDARVIVFAYGAPYYLDTTEISQLTAYFGVYSKVDAFVDASVRALFQESPLTGRSPVSIEGIRYDLFEITKPDPQQVIELFIVDDGTPKSPLSEEPLEAVPGATLRLQTGVIADRNANPVPDGTLVQFVQQDRIQGFVNVIGERPTRDGIANLDYLLEARSGNFRITAAAGEAQASQEINIVIGENAIVSINTPTPGPTLSPTASSTPTPSSTATTAPTPTPTHTPIPTATPEPAAPTGQERLGTFYTEAQMLFYLGVGLFVTGGVGYAVARNESNNLNRIVRCVLWGLVGGLVAYNYFALGLPGASWLVALGVWAGLLTTLAGGIVGLLLYRLLTASRT